MVGNFEKIKQEGCLVDYFLNLVEFFQMEIKRLEGEKILEFYFIIVDNDIVERNVIRGLQYLKGEEREYFEAELFFFIRFTDRSFRNIVVVVQEFAEGDC